MRSFVARLTANRQTASSVDSHRISLATATDPNSWLTAFTGHWEQASSVMHTSQRATVTMDHIDKVFGHLDEMAFLLLTEVNASPVPTIGAILDVFFTDEIMLQVVTWCLATPLRHTAVCQVRLLKLYESEWQ